MSEAGVLGGEEFLLSLELFGKHANTMRLIALHNLFPVLPWRSLEFELNDVGQLYQRFTWITRSEVVEGYKVTGPFSDPYRL